MSGSKLPVVGISCGDLNGIGMEVIMKSLSNPDMLNLCTPAVFAASKVASYHRKVLEMEHFNFHGIPSAARIQPGKVNLVNCWNEELVLELGKISPLVGSYALKSLEAACEALEANQIDALVTAPIHKNSIQSREFHFTGHTDYLENRFKGTATMLLVSDLMRMALATVHIPINEVATALSIEDVLARLRRLGETLHQDFLIKKGKIAVLALNPHAGDGGVIGTEDDDLVAPAIRRAFDEGIMAFGPFPADSFFGQGRHTQYDAVLAMYHDQGLIPFKTLSFGSGVNYSSGLNIIRTSPDHGTGFDIAGKGRANESSFREAIYLAIDLIRNRALSKEVGQNPLKLNKGRKEH